MKRADLKLVLLAVIAMNSASFYPIIPAAQEGAEVVRRLEELHYFKYANPDQLPELKEDLVKSYNKYKLLSTVVDDETLLPYDYRLYFCDGEGLFEDGGIETYLEYARHAFEKRGLTLNWSNEVSKQKGQNLTHKITVNEKEYTAFEGNARRINVWGIAQLNFYTLLNDQLAIQGSDERVYPISAGEDGYFAILSPELYEYISTTFYQGEDFRNWDKMYPLDQWAKVHNLK